MLNLFALKMKVKSLAAESQIIRHQELKFKGKSWCHLADPLIAHRRGPLRSEARDTHVAYGFLKGRTYRQIEDNPKTEPNWDNIARMVKKHGTKEFTETLHTWRVEKTVKVVDTASAGGDGTGSIDVVTAKVVA